MSLRKHDREYDLVVLGATGYTGTLTAEHIATHLATNLKWAVAGRSEEKLRQVVSHCQALNSDRVPPAIEICQVNDKDLGTLARKTFCMITTLGPYIQLGEHAFKACAEAGTHYMDCTGEVPFTVEMIRKYEQTAKKTGACMFPQSGIESAPSDLLTWALVSTIRSELSDMTSDVVMDMHRLDSAPSGGTLASALNMIDALPISVLLASLKPYALSPVANEHRAPKMPLLGLLTGLVKIPGLDLLTTSPTGSFNAALVFRTWGLTKQEAHLQKDFYGPRFTYREFMRAPNALAGMLMHYGFIVGGGLLLIPPARSLIRKVMFKPGEGPDKERAKKELIEFQAVAKPDSEANAHRQAYGRFSFSGSMYYLTATILAQEAAALLEERSQKLTGGVYTPACLGQRFIDRLRSVGVQIETNIGNV